MPIVIVKLARLVADTSEPVKAAVADEPMITVSPAPGAPDGLQLPDVAQSDDDAPVHCFVAISNLSKLKGRRHHPSPPAGWEGGSSAAFCLYGISLFNKSRRSLQLPHGVIPVTA